MWPKRAVSRRVKTPSNRWPSPAACYAPHHIHPIHPLSSPSPIPSHPSRSPPTLPRLPPNHPHSQRHSLRGTPQIRTKAEARLARPLFSPSPSLFSHDSFVHRSTHPRDTIATKQQQGNSNGSAGPRTYILCIVSCYSYCCSRSHDGLQQLWCRRRRQLLHQPTRRSTTSSLLFTTHTTTAIIPRHHGSAAASAATATATAGVRQ
jgi:hypothetical protein